MRRHDSSALFVVAFVAVLGCGGRLIDAGDPVEAVGPATDARVTPGDAADAAHETSSDAGRDSGVDVVIDTGPPVTAAECTGPGSVIALWGDADDPIYSYAHGEESGATPGGIVIRGGGDFRAESRRSDWIDISFYGPISSWDLEFSTEGLGFPLTVGKYPGAARADFAGLAPGLDVSGDGFGCNTLSGRFEITEVKWDGTMFQSFTATFEQHCDEMTPALRGCVHFER